MQPCSRPDLDVVLLLVGICACPPQTWWLDQVLHHLLQRCVSLCAPFFPLPFWLNIPQDLHCHCGHCRGASTLFLMDATRKREGVLSILCGQSTFAHLHFHPCAHHIVAQGVARRVCIRLVHSHVISCLSVRCLSSLLSPFSLSLSSTLSVVLNFNLHDVEHAEY